MKLILTVIGVILPAFLWAADIRPDSSGTPIFQVFELIKTGPDTYDSGPDGRPTHHWKTDDKHPLLVVQSLNDFLLEEDKKNVRVVLNKKDAAIMAEAFRKYGVLGITAGDAATIIMSSTRFDGSLTFDDPIAADLRHQFHIKPNTNEMESAH